jgi:Pyruvate/2-oxoacid:ferredoxin oxidoreductase delta subunit
MSMRRLLQVDERDPLSTARTLLSHVWMDAKLDGMLIPSWIKDQPFPMAVLQQDPRSLVQSDPFTPIMPQNIAGTAAALVQHHPDKRLGLSLRPCELRSLILLADRDGLDLSDTLLFSTDCLSVFPLEDIHWRLGEVKDKDQLTHDALQFAAQGGILPNRFKISCQLCDVPYPQSADVQIELLGIATHQHLIVDLSDKALAMGMGFESMATEEIPPEVDERRQQVLDKLANWRRRSMAYTQSHLDETLSTLTGLVHHLQSCQPCRTRLQEQCPLFAPEKLGSPSLSDLDSIKAWISSCGGCGMCDYHCPNAYPLFTTILHLHQRLTSRGGKSRH